MGVVMFVRTSLGVYLCLNAFKVFDIQCYTFAHVDRVFGLEEKQIGCERIEPSRHFRKGVRDGDDIDHFLSSADHDVVYLLVGTVTEVGTTVIENEDAFFEGGDGIECPWTEDMPLDSHKDVVVSRSEFVSWV